MRYLAENYYEAEQLAMMFVEIYDGKCYTECEGHTLSVYDDISKKVIFEVAFEE